MYNAFMFEAKNRKNKVYCMVIVFNQNGNPVFCKRHNENHQVVLKREGFKNKNVSYPYPFGVVEVSVSKMRAIYGEIMTKLIKKIGG